MEIIENLLNEGEHPLREIEILEDVFERMSDSLDEDDWEDVEFQCRERLNVITPLELAWELAHDYGVEFVTREYLDVL
jgi:hypothetical protein